MRGGSFFTGSHLKLHEIVEISYWWASETSVSKTIQQTGHSDHRGLVHFSQRCMRPMAFERSGSSRREVRALKPRRVALSR